MPKRKRRDHRTDGSLAWDVEEKFSRGQRQFETCDDWMLPDEQSLFAADAFELEDFMLLKSDLNSCKSKLNDVEIDQWHMHTKRAHAGGVIVFSLREQCNAELCTQAWVKFYEVLVHHSLVTLDCEATFTVHLCEAPGAFITALNHYLRADGRQARWNWLASTLNPYHGANTTDSMVDDDRFIQFTRDNWFFCDDDSGNLMLASNIASIRRKARELAVEWLSSSDGGERCGKDIPATSPSSEAVTPASSADSVSCCDELGSESDVMHHDDSGEDLCFGHADLVTADGSVDCQDVPAEQESHVAALHFCEVVTSLGLLKRGGALVVKMFTLLEHSSVCLLYLLNCTFDEVCRGEGYVCVCACACVHAPYGAAIYAVDFQSKRCGFDPRQVRPHTFFFLLYLCVVADSRMCMSVYVMRGEKKLSMAKSSHYEPCGVRPGSPSGGQFDQPCKLFDGAILVQVLW